MPTRSILSAKKKRFGVVICGGSGPVNVEGSRRIGLYSTDPNTDQEWKIFCAPEGDIPSKEDIDAFDGFLMFGSYASTLEDASWMRELEAFVQSVATRNSPKPKLVGICFSHQLCAKALGGKVGPNPSNKYVFKNEKIVSGEDLKDMGLEGPFHIVQSHGECILDLPQGAKSLARSETCEHEIVLFKDNILGVQGHPDYSFETMLEKVFPIVTERGIVSKEDAVMALKSFQTPTHEKRVNKFLMNFLDI